MKIVISIIAIVTFCFSCTQKNAQVNNKLDKAWLDSIIKSSDSSYAKPYFRTDFVTAFYYINKKDSIVCQLMKDSAQTIRQIIITKKDKRTFFAKYFANGQLQTKTPFDQSGQYHGTIINYYQNGNIEDSGNYIHGSREGQFKSYDSTGQLMGTEIYKNDERQVK